MHAVLARQLKRAGLTIASLPQDAESWTSLLQAIDRAYVQADDDRYLMERSLQLSSEEMGDLHTQLANERDTISSVICSLGEGICAVNHVGAVLFINPEAKRLLRLDGHETIIGRRLDELVIARSADGRTLASMLVDGTAANLTEARLIVAEDESQYIACTVTVLGNAYEGLVITLRDISERTRLEADRAELNRRLLDTSRQAGMAEVAVGVLHNVGNVLNSVNVSATIASEYIKQSKASDLSKLSKLLDSNRSRLGEFVTNDPAGSKLPEYIEKLAQRLEKERAGVLRELTQLHRDVDHIREIVATQQSYAKGAGASIKQPEEMASIIDDALRITEAALARDHVQVVRDLGDLPPVLVERHQVLQVLINLITNANKAVCAGNDADRRVTIRLRSQGGDLSISVIDNGIGIAPDLIPRLFGHGFTTDPQGHGFGLHSAALAAKALGGSLVGRSDGPGCGATFTLEFPTEGPHMRAAA